MSNSSGTAEPEPPDDRKSATILPPSTAGALNRGEAGQPSVPRLLLVHAHPDDETINTGGTIAYYCNRGVQVTVLTCTLGEEGEVIGDRWAGLVAAAADQLGGYRILELTRALAELGVTGGPRFLGGAGRRRDSGMADSGPSDPRAFVHADPQEAIADVGAVIAELRPHVVVSYDPRGGYGHPDHILAHRYTTAAVAASAEAGWMVPKFYWTVTDRGTVEQALSNLTLPDGCRIPTAAELDSFTTDNATTVIDIGAQLDAKRAALRAHATQVVPAPDGASFALSNFIVQPLPPVEHYVLASGTLGSVAADGFEHDLFSGIPELEEGR